MDSLRSFIIDTRQDSEFLKAIPQQPGKLKNNPELSLQQKTGPSGRTYHRWVRTAPHQLTPAERLAKKPGQTLSYEMTHSEEGPLSREFPQLKHIASPDAREKITRAISRPIHAALKEFFPDLKVKRWGTGGGGWLDNPVVPCLVTRLDGNPERIQQAAALIGYLAQQDAMLVSKPLDPKKDGAKIEPRTPQGAAIFGTGEQLTKANLETFWYEFRKHEPWAAGFMPLEARDKAGNLHHGIGVLHIPQGDESDDPDWKLWSDEDYQRIDKSMHLAAAKAGVTLHEDLTGRYRAQAEFQFQNWKEDPHGSEYLQRINLRPSDLFAGHPGDGLSGPQGQGFEPGGFARRLEHYNGRVQAARRRAFRRYAGREVDRHRHTQLQSQAAGHAETIYKSETGVPGFPVPPGGQLPDGHIPVKNQKGQIHYDEQNGHRKREQGPRPVVPTFYSHLQQVVQTKMPVRAKPEDVKNLVNKHGVTQDEQQWSGLHDHLKDKEVVHKHELLEHLEKHTPKIEEFEYHNEGEEESDKIAKQLGNLGYNVWVDDYGTPILNDSNSGIDYTSIDEESIPEDASDLFRQWHFLNQRGEDSHVTKWDKYEQEDLVLPGGRNYRELLLKLPDNKALQNDIEATKAEINERQRWLDEEIDEYNASDEPDDDGSGSKHFEEQRAEIRQKTKELDELKKQARNESYTSPHWDDHKNVLAHVRYDEREDVDGNKLLFLQEVQSDWHQAGREQGYSGERQKLNGELDDLRAHIKKIEGLNHEIYKKVQEVVGEEERGHSRAKHRIGQLQSELDYNNEVKSDPEKVAAYKKEIAELDKKIPTAFGWLAEKEKVREQIVEKEPRFKEARAVSLNDLNSRVHQIENRLLELREAVPDAPFKKTESWAGLAFRRMLRQACEEGKDGVGWTTGEQQGERYGLEKKIYALEYSPHLNYLNTYDHEGNSQYFEVPPEKLADHIGKEVAERLLATKRSNGGGGSHYLEGDDLKVRENTGMVKFYDSMLPQIANKIGKKYGAQVVSTQIDTQDKSQPPLYRVLDSHGDPVKLMSSPHRNELEDFASRYEGYRVVHSHDPRLESVHMLTITPELREAVLHEGQPLFKSFTPQFQLTLAKSKHVLRKAIAGVITPHNPGMVPVAPLGQGVPNEKGQISYLPGPAPGKVGTKKHRVKGKKQPLENNGASDIHLADPNAPVAIAYAHRSAEQDFHHHEVKPSHYEPDPDDIFTSVAETPHYRPFARDAEKVDHMGAPPNHNFYAPEEQQALVRRSHEVAHSKAKGRPVNKAFTVHLPGNELPIYVGPVSNEQWIDRVFQAFDNGHGELDHEAFNNARFWYERVWPEFQKVFGKDARKWLNGWLASQAGKGPGSGMLDTLRASDHVRGLKKLYEAGTNAPAIRHLLQGYKMAGGMAAKLSDFTDSTFGLLRRTVAGYHHKAGQPACIDIWAMRDLGMMTPKSKNELLSHYPSLKRKLKLDNNVAESPSDLQYEYCSQRYNDLAKHLNAHPELGLGSNWTASQVQAVGWMAIQKAWGKKGGTAQSMFDDNTRAFHTQFEFGNGSIRKAIGSLSQFDKFDAEGKPVLDAEGRTVSQAIAHEVMHEVAHFAARECNVILRGMKAGDSFNGESRGYIEAMGSPESLSAFACTLGHVLQQNKVTVSRPMFSKGHSVFIDVHDPEGAHFTPELRKEFVSRLKSHLDQKSHEENVQRSGGQEDLFSESEVGFGKKDVDYWGLIADAELKHLPRSDGHKPGIRFTVPKPLDKDEKGLAQKQVLMDAVNHVAHQMVAEHPELNLSHGCGNLELQEYHKDGKLSINLPEEENYANILDLQHKRPEEVNLIGQGEGRKEPSPESLERARKELSRSKELINNGKGYLRGLDSLGRSTLSGEVSHYSARRLPGVLADAIRRHAGVDLSARLERVARSGLAKDGREFGKSLRLTLRNAMNLQKSHVKGHMAKNPSGAGEHWVRDHEAGKFTMQATHRASGKSMAKFGFPLKGDALSNRLLDMANAIARDEKVMGSKEGSPVLAITALRRLAVAAALEKVHDNHSEWKVRSMAQAEAPKEINAHSALDFFKKNWGVGDYMRAALCNHENHFTLHSPDKEAAHTYHVKHVASVEKSMNTPSTAHATAGAEHASGHVAEHTISSTESHPAPTPVKSTPLPSTIKKPKVKKPRREQSGIAKTTEERMATQTYAPTTVTPGTNAKRRTTLPTQVVTRRDGHTQRYHKKIGLELKVKARGAMSSGKTSTPKAAPKSPDKATVVHAPLSKITPVKLSKKTRIASGSVSRSSAAPKTNADKGLLKSLGVVTVQKREDGSCLLLES